MGAVAGRPLRDRPPQDPGVLVRARATVEELSALHVAHRAAFDPAAAPTAPTEWHQVFGSARARLQLGAARTGCRAGEHRPDQRAGWAADPMAAGYMRAFGAHVEADLDSRAG